MTRTLPAAALRARSATRFRPRTTAAADGATEQRQQLANRRRALAPGQADGSGRPGEDRGTDRPG